VANTSSHFSGREGLNSHLVVAFEPSATDGRDLVDFSTTGAPCLLLASFQCLTCYAAEAIKNVELVQNNAETRQLSAPVLLYTSSQAFSPF
jgi:hypothetical protein